MADHDHVVVGKVAEDVVVAINVLAKAVDDRDGRDGSGRRLGMRNGVYNDVPGM